MSQRHRILWAAAAAPLLSIALLPAGSAPARAAAPATLTIHVDNAPPAGHSWEFLDYFPRSGVNIHNGDVLHYVFNTASVDGFHNVTLGASGETAAQINNSNPATGADSGPSDGDPAGTKNFTAFFGTFPPPGSGAPTACGDVTTPCVYDGTQEINSGAMFPGGPTEFFFQIQLPTTPTSTPVVVNYICTVHGATMNGSFSVVPDAATASTQSDLDAAAATQYASDVAAGQAVESAVGAAAVTTNADGTHTVSMTAGTEAANGNVQILEMLPSSVSVQPGDHVTWKAVSSHDPHTVTFPDGSGSNSVDPFPMLCDSASGADTPISAGPPTFGCTGAPGSPNGFEIGWEPQAQGGTSISTTTTVATSGVLDSGTHFGTVPNTYSFTFPSSGTFLYQCRIHDHMTGQVLVAAITVPATGAAANQTPAGVSNLMLVLILVPLGSLLIVFAALLARRRLVG